MDYVPLAIDLIAQVGTGHSCNYILEQWKSVRTALLQTQGSKANKLTSIEISIEVSLKSSTIVEEVDAVQLLAIISYLPDGLQNWQQKVDKVTGIESSHKAVNALLKASLIFMEASSLKVLSPIRYYILSKYPAPRHHIARLEEYYMALISEYAGASYGAELVY